MAHSFHHFTEAISSDRSDTDASDRMDWSTANFTILDDDQNNQIEEGECQSIFEHYNQDFDFDYIDNNVDEEEMIVDDPNTEIVEEQALSQKLSQLSTNDERNDADQNYTTTAHKKRPFSTPSTPDVVSKKIRLEEDSEHGKHHVPEYLQLKNEIFQKILIDHAMNGSMMATTPEDLQQLAVLKHEIATLHMETDLWTVYLKLGTGQWKTYESNRASVDRRIWPVEVRKLMVLLVDTPDSYDQEEEQQRSGETIVQQHLQELNSTCVQYKNELDEKKTHLKDDYNDGMDKAIDSFIEQHSIQPLRIKLHDEIALLEHNYDTEILEREYLQLQPSQYQIEYAKQLYTLRSRYLQAKQELIELKQRLLWNKPAESMYSSMLDPLLSATDQETQVLQEKLTDSMLASIIQVEDRILTYQQLFDEAILQLSPDDHGTNEKGFTRELADIIYRRLKMMNKRLNNRYDCRNNPFSKKTSEYFENQMMNSRISFLPTMLIHTSAHQLTEEQLKLLNRGPTYTPPCQIHVSSSVNQSMDDLIQKHYKLLQHQLTITFAKFHINMTRSMFLNKEIKSLFHDMFSIALPPSLHQRAVREKQLVQSIREQFKTKKLLLRRLANQTNVFYLGNREDFHEKANEYMMKTDAFEFCEAIDQVHLQQTRDYLNKIIKSLNSDVENVFEKKKNAKDVLKKLHIDAAKVQLPYLYFLPDISKNKNLSLNPVVVTQRSTTTRLAHFLDKLLRPVIKRQAESTTVTNGADFLRKLNQYIEPKHRLRPGTFFVTLDISNWSTIAEHGTMLIVLTDFLNRSLPTPYLDNISVNQIVHLTSLFLHHNRFYYDHKIYRFMKGSPNSFPLTKTLSNIYLYQWQQVLLREPLLRDEFYGRCHNQIFFTWNSTVHHFRQVLVSIGRKYSNVQIDAKMSSEIEFCNVHLENQNGTLYTCVYHNPTHQKYTLPYVIGDTQVAHSHWFRSALIRAVRYCTSVADFHQERIYLEVTCLTNGYSLEFVEQRINHFFKYFAATSLRSSMDQKDYDKLRHRLFNFISEQHRFLEDKEEQEKNNRRVQLTYHYQFGRKYHFEKRLREILSENLHLPTQAFEKKKINFIFNTTQQYSLNALLSQQEPYHPFLNTQNIMFF